MSRLSPADLDNSINSYFNIQHMHCYMKPVLYLVITGSLNRILNIPKRLVIVIALTSAETVVRAHNYLYISPSSAHYSTILFFFL